jgi:hypothetical protein
VGFLPARRESRRFVGAHVLTQQEIQAREQFEDTVAYGGWSIDDHTRGGITAIEKKPSFDSVRIVDYFTNPYPIPLRSLHAAQVPNLLFAGRCMSASRVAFLSLRVQQTLATTGQAAGTAAAWCVARDLTPREIGEATEIQQRLLRDDAWLPGVEAEHLARDCRGAVARASSEAALRCEPGKGGASLSTKPAAMFPVTAAHLECARLFLANDGDPAEVTLALHPAADMWEIEALDRAPVASVEVQVPAGESRVEARLDADVDPGMYWLLADGPEQLTWRFAAENAPATCARMARAGSSAAAGRAGGRWR